MLYKMVNNTGRKMANETEPQNVEEQWVEKVDPCRDELSGALIQANPELIWNAEAILNDLKKNHVKEKNVEEMGYQWKRVYIDFPAVGSFKWFKFDYFVSEDKISKDELKSNPKLKEKLHSFSEIWKLLQAMNSYMKEFGVKTDYFMDYADRLKYYHTDYHNCVAWNYLKDITGLNSRYWTYQVSGLSDFGCWRCDGDYCGFGWDTLPSHVFMK